MVAATKRRRRKSPKDHVAVRGFFRIRVTEGDLDKPDSLRVIGETNVDENGNLIDDGFLPNTVTNLGFDQFLCQTLAGMAGSKTVSHMAVGTGGAPAASDTSLSGEITHATNDRKTVSPTTVASKTAQFTAAFNSSDSFLTASANLSNVGLFNTSTTAAGTLFAGNTFASSAVATNNNLQVTYQIRFS